MKYLLVLLGVFALTACAPKTVNVTEKGSYGEFHYEETKQVPLETYIKINCYAANGAWIGSDDAICKQHEPKWAQGCFTPAGSKRMICPKVPKF